MTAFFHLLRWEFRRLARTRSAFVISLGLLIAGLFAIWSGAKEIAREQREIDGLHAHYTTQMEQIAARYPTGEHAGYVAYYTFFPTHHAASGLAKLSLGLRDVAPMTLWVRMLGLEGQLYESGLGNPALQSLGNFDLSFVICALAPLMLLVLTHDILSRDRDHGRFSLLAAQAGSLARLFFARLLASALLVAALCTLLFGVAVVWVRIPCDTAALGWLAGLWAYLACWTAAAGLIAALCRTVGASVATALASWVVSVVLLPALLNLAVATAFPVTEGLALTVRQRQESHARWDKPRAETLALFFARYPEWSGTSPVTGRFAWKWYYAMQQVGDDSVANESAAYRGNLLARQRVLERLAWLTPSTYAQTLFSRQAGTDLDAHLAYLDRVRAFHEELKLHFYPLVFAEQKLLPADYARFPRYTATAPQIQAGSLAPLLILAAALFTATAFTLRRLTYAHA